MMLVQVLVVVAEVVAVVVVAAPAIGSAKHWALIENFLTHPYKTNAIVFTNIPNYKLFTYLTHLAMLFFPAKAHF